MKIERTGPDEARIEATQADLLTLRLCILEALEALSAEEFQIRVGAPKSDAEGLLEELRRGTTSAFWASDGGG